MAAMVSSPLRFRSCQSGRVVIMRLDEVPTDPAEVPKVTQLLERSYKACGERILLINVLHDGLQRPNDDVLTVLKAAFRANFENYIEMAIVVMPEMAGFRRALFRSLFTGVILALRLRGRILSVDSVEEALALFHKHARIDIAAARREAFLAGLHTS